MIISCRGIGLRERDLSHDHYGTLCVCSHAPYRRQGADGVQAIYKIAYTWSFLQRDKGCLGITAGLYVADINTTLSAPSIAAREVSSITAPLPVFGLRGEHHFSDKWLFRASGEVFALEYGDFDGSPYDIYVGLDYQLFDRMAIGVGFNSVRMDLGVTKENANGNLDWQYDGGWRCSVLIPAIFRHRTRGPSGCLAAMRFRKRKFAA